MSTDAATVSKYDSGEYWEARQNLFYYQYIRNIVDFLAIPGGTVIDVGSGNAPYLDWFDWASFRMSVDINVPYSSTKVEGLKADILDHEFDRKFDFCLCFQVLEHIEEPAPFAQRLFDLGNTVIISVPYKWRRGSAKGHLQDPVDRKKLEGWVQRTAEYDIVVTEPMKHRSHRRLISVYDPHMVNPAMQTFLAQRKRAKPASPPPIAKSQSSVAGS